MSKEKDVMVRLFKDFFKLNDSDFTAVFVVMSKLLPDTPLTKEQTDLIDRFNALPDRGQNIILRRLSRDFEMAIRKGPDGKSVRQYRIDKKSKIED